MTSLPPSDDDLNSDAVGTDDRVAPGLDSNPTERAADGHPAGESRTDSPDELATEPALTAADRVQMRDPSHDSLDDLPATDPDELPPDRERAPLPSAADRTQSRDASASQRPKQRVRPMRLALLGLVGAAVAVGAVMLRGGGEPGTDLFEHLESTASEFRPDLVTVDATAAERYVLDAFGWPVEVPELPDLQLVGVGEASVLETPALSVSMPAFRYDARGDESLVVFVYDYVLLDGTQGALDLTEAVYARLAESPSVDVRRQGGLSFVSWRVRAAVYTAVTDDEEIAESIARSVSG